MGDNQKRTETDTKEEMKNDPIVGKLFALESGMPFFSNPSTIIIPSNHQISIGELFSSSLFCIPAMLLHNHGFIVNSLLTWMVFAVSLMFHRHNVETCSNPNTFLRCFDISSTLIACTLLVINGYNDLYVMLSATGVPLFYALERFAMWRNGGDNAELCGPAGAHVLLHLSAIVACCCLAFTEGSISVDVSNDIETICFGFIMGSFFFVIFQPRKYGKHITNGEMITALLGVAKEVPNAASSQKQKWKSPFAKRENAITVSTHQMTNIHPPESLHI